MMLAKYLSQDCSHVTDAYWNLSTRAGVNVLRSTENKLQNESESSVREQMVNILILARRLLGVQQLWQDRSTTACTEKV